MKSVQYLASLAALCCLNFSSLAQNSQATLITPAVKAVVNNNGALFTDGQKGQFIIPFVPGQAEISTLGAAGLWLGGVDPASNLKIAVQMYETGINGDFVPGVLDQNGVNAQMPGMYRVTREEIQAHLDDYFGNGMIDNPQPGVFGWPGRGNPFFAQYHGFDLPFTQQALAGFYDRDGDGLYNPAAGDYPSVEIRGCGLYIVPSEMVWFVFNDMNPGGHPVSGASPLQMEVQCQMFTIFCDSDEGRLNRTVFARYKLINRGVERLDSTYVGLFTDFNIGNENDDFFGCDTSRSLVFGYNGDANDEGFYGNYPPIMAVKMFRGPLDENGEQVPLSAVVPVDTAAIDHPGDYYRLLTGNLPGGAAGPTGGIAFPGNPWEPGSNSEIALGNIPGNRAVLSAFGPFSLLPGAVNEFIAGFYANSDLDQSTAFENLLLDVDILQDFYDGCFNNTGLNCGAVLDAEILHASIPNVRIFPNPVQDGWLWVDSESPFQQIRLLSTDGRLVRDILFTDATKTQISLETLPSGVYFMELRFCNGAVGMERIVR